MTTPAEPPAKGGKKKFPSMSSPTTWVVILGIAVVVGGYLLYRNRKAASTAATTATTTTADTTDWSGEIATLQAEIADLQSTMTQDERGEEADTDDKTKGHPPVHPLKAPPAPNVSPHESGTDVSWSAVTGARAYELLIEGATGRGTGHSHFQHVYTGTHATGIRLGNGRYVARVRAGTSTANVHGPWSPDHEFRVGPNQQIGGGKPPRPPTKRRM